MESCCRRCFLNYSGQTALPFEHRAIGGNPFFRLAPGWAIFPLVALASVATIIASQAIITGSFSLTRQAMQLGWFPGMRIRQTSADENGQIYVPFVNWTMMLLTIALTIGLAAPSVWLAPMTPPSQLHGADDRAPLYRDASGLVGALWPS
jgi:K+ transporter